MTEHMPGRIVHERTVLQGTARCRVVRAGESWRVEYLADWSDGTPSVQATFDTVEAAIADCEARAARAEVLWSVYLDHLLEGNR